MQHIVFNIEFGGMGNCQCYGQGNFNSGQDQNQVQGQENFNPVNTYTN